MKLEQEGPMYNLLVYCMSDHAKFNPDSDIIPD